MKLSSLLQEAEQDTKVNAMDQAMASAFKQLGREFEAGKQAAQTDVEKANIQIAEAVGVVTVISALLAAPKIIDLLARGLQKMFDLYKRLFKKDGAKSEQEQIQVAKSIIDFTHKWHKQYILGVKWILKTAGLFKKAGIKGDANQTKAAELIYYTIVAGLAVYSGVGALSAFKSAAQTADIGGFSFGTFEAAMSAVKSKEVTSFLAKLNLA